MSAAGAMGLKLLGVALSAVFAVIFGRKLYNRSLTEREAVEEYDEFQMRLVQPDFDSIQKTFGAIPDDLRALYENPELLLKKNFFFTGVEEHFVSAFLPADKETLKDFHVDSSAAMPFAQEKPGRFYVALIDPLNLRQCAVYLVAENEKPQRKISDSMSVFISRPTRPAR